MRFRDCKGTLFKERRQGRSSELPEPVVSSFCFFQIEMVDVFDDSSVYYYYTYIYLYVYVCITVYVVIYVYIYYITSDVKMWNHIGDLKFIGVKYFSTLPFRSNLFIQMILPSTIDWSVHGVVIICCHTHHSIYMFHFWIKSLVIFILLAFYIYIYGLIDLSL